MKRKALFFSVLLFAAAAFPGSDDSAYREFTGTNGKKLHARLLGYDPRTGKVYLRCRKGTRRIPLKLFCGEDRRFILDWAMGKSFQDEVTVKLKQRKEEDKKSAKLYEFDMTQYFYYWFEIELENRSPFDFKQVTVEYDIFYVQEDLGPDKQSKVRKEGVYYEEREEALDLPRRKKVRFTTDRLYLFKYTGENNILNFPDMKGWVEGIILKLRLQLPSGKEIVRTVRYPASLDEQWTEEEVDVQCRR